MYIDPVIRYIKKISKVFDTQQRKYAKLAHSTIWGTFKKSVDWFDQTILIKLSLSN